MFSITDIEQQIKTKGIALLKSIDDVDYHNILYKLGKVLYTTEVKLTPGKSNVVYNYDAIPFHSDYPKADLVVWLCLDSNKLECANELLDISMIESMNNYVIKSLSTIKIYFKCKITKKIYSIPLVIKYRYGIGTTYNPWGIQVKLSDEQSSSYKEFMKIISSAPVNSIYLEERDLLIIDNRRILHGRKEISTSSTRHLKRSFIQVESIT